MAGGISLYDAGQEEVTMPIVRYQCKQCENTWETFYKTFTEREQDEPKEPCPKCDSVDKSVQIGGTSFILKGGGWAKDLYGGRRKK
jgi:putative FmdB family regulatory protein